MNDAIRVLIVDDVADTTEHVARLLSFESDIKVVASAMSGEEALKLAAELRPDIVLMDINMPGLDGIETTERLARTVPSASTIMMSVQAEGDYLRRSMLAGARGYLVKPFNADELADSIRNVFARRVESGGQLVAVGPGAQPVHQSQPGRLIAVFSPKGGAGTTTVATNLAIAIAQMGKRVAFVDADLQFGDAGVFLNLDPTKASFADVAAEMAQDNIDAVDSALLTHRSGIRVLLSPPTPDSADLITGEYMRNTLTHLIGAHEVVIVDCASHLNDQTLAVLDMANEIVCPISLDIPAIRSVRVFLGVAEQLGYPETKLRLVVNRADTNYGIKLEDVERSVGRKVDHIIIADARAAVHALNYGVPFVLGNKRAPVAQDVIGLAESLFKETDEPAVTEEQPKARPERRLAFARR